MRFSKTAAISAAALLSGVNADAQSVLKEASSSVSSVASEASEAVPSSTSIVLPTFTVSCRHTMHHSKTQLDLPDTNSAFSAYIYQSRLP